MGDPSADSLIRAFERWEERIRELAKEDGLQHLKTEPDRRYLFSEYVPASGYPTFSMFSELGAHPGAVGNILFAMRPDSHMLEFALGEAFAERSFWIAAAIVELWMTCEAISPLLGWDDWLESVAKPTYERAGPLMEEALRRRREQS